MKISNKQLTKMVNEEIQQMVDEGFFGKMGHKMGFETGETKRIDSLLMQVARALEEATGDYGLDLDYEDDPVQAVNDFVDRIGGLFMRAGLPKKDFAEAKKQFNAAAATALQTSTSIPVQFPDASALENPGTPSETPHLTKPFFCVFFKVFDFLAAITSELNANSIPNIATNENKFLSVLFIFVPLFIYYC